MVLSLLIYSVAQFKMRNHLEEHDGTIPDQKKLKSLNQSLVTDLKISPDFISDLLMAVPTFSHTKKF
jgi:transposase